MGVLECKPTNYSSPWRKSNGLWLAEAAVMPGSRTRICFTHIKVAGQQGQVTSITLTAMGFVVV